MSLIIPLPPLSQNKLSLTQPKSPFPHQQETNPEASVTFSDILFNGPVEELSKSLNRASKASEMGLKQPGVDSLKTALEVLNASTAVRQGTAIFATALQSYREITHMTI
jgi:flagellar hook-basal body complex protein FliE